MIMFVLLAGCVGLQSVPAGAGAAVSSTVGGVTLSGSAVDFGEVLIGEVGEETLVLTNGDQGLTHINATLTGEEFAADQVGFDLMKGGEKVITLNFTPADVGTFTGRLSLEVGEESTQVPLTGIGTDDTAAGGDDTSGGGGDDPAGELTTDVPSLAFGTMDLGATSMKVVTVSNTGDAALTVDSATCSDASFVLGGNLTPPRTLDPGDERVIEVTFTPAAEKAYSANLVLTSDDPNAPKTTIAMTGTGRDECDVCSPRIEVDTGSSSDYSITDFTTLFGADTRTITIGNDGDMDLDISQVDVNNDFLQTCGTFSVGGWKGATTVKAGRTTTFTITYKTTDTCLDIPQKAIDANVVHILSNDPAEADYIIELGGLGF